MKNCNKVICLKCDLPFSAHEYDYDHKGRVNKNIVYCKCPTCGETIHKDNELLTCQCSSEKVCQVCHHSHVEKENLKWTRTLDGCL